MRTNVYRELISHSDTRLICFLDNQKRVDICRREFNHDRIIYETVEHFRPAFLDSFFQAVSFYFINTETIRLKRFMAWEETKNPIHFLTALINLVVAHGFVRRCIRILDYVLVRDTNFKKFFEQYKPDVVLLAHLFERREVNLLREAKRQKVPTVGFINSWDKVTGRCGIRLLPDRMAVFNSLVRQEVIEHVDMPESQVVVIGLPQYDIYTKREPHNRKKVWDEFNIDIQKRIIVYAPMGRTYSNSDWDIIDFLQGAIENNSIQNAALLVRFQPNDFFDETELKKRPWLKYDHPGIRFSTERGVDWDMSFKDIDNLRHILESLSVLVCYASSMSIDAAVFNKPVINIDFETRKEKLLRKSPTAFYRFSHYRKMLEADGVALVKTSQELIDRINEYLNNPLLHSDKRALLVKEQCGIFDGRSGERLAKLVTDTAKNTYSSTNVA